MRHQFGNALRLESGHHFVLTHNDEVIETLRILLCVLLRISVKSIAFEYARARSVVEKGIEAFEDSGCGRLSDVLIEFGVRIENEGSAEVEEERVIVELVIGECVESREDEDAAHEYLNVGEQKDDENEAFEVEFAVGERTESVASCEHYVAD